MAKPVIPDVPTFRFNGKRPPAKFTEGVYSLRQLLCKLHDYKEAGLIRQTLSAPKS
jgi:hypothetical protein